MHSRGPGPAAGKESFLYSAIPSPGSPETLYCLVIDFLEASRMKKTQSETKHENILKRKEWLVRAQDFELVLSTGVFIMKRGP